MKSVARSSPAQRSNHTSDGASSLVATQSLSKGKPNITCIQQLGEHDAQQGCMVRGREFLVDAGMRGAQVYPGCIVGSKAGNVKHQSLDEVKKNMGNDSSMDEVRDVFQNVSRAEKVKITEHDEMKEEYENHERAVLKELVDVNQRLVNTVAAANEATGMSLAAAEITSPVVLTTRLETAESGGSPQVVKSSPPYRELLQRARPSLSPRQPPISPITPPGPSQSEQVKYFEGMLQKLLDQKTKLEKELREVRGKLSRLPTALESAILVIRQPLSARKLAQTWDEHVERIWRATQRALADHIKAYLPQKVYAELVIMVEEKSGMSLDELYTNDTAYAWMWKVIGSLSREDTLENYALRTLDLFAVPEGNGFLEISSSMAMKLAVMTEFDGVKRIVDLFVSELRAYERLVSKYPGLRPVLVKYWGMGVKDVDEATLREFREAVRSHVPELLRVQQGAAGRGARAPTVAASAIAPQQASSDGPQHGGNRGNGGSDAGGGPAGPVCYNCKSSLHLLKDCPEPQMCYCCRSTEHVKKDCPHKGRCEQHARAKSPKKDKGDKGTGGEKDQAKGKFQMTAKNRSGAAPVTVTMSNRLKPLVAVAAGAMRESPEARLRASRIARAHAGGNIFDKTGEVKVLFDTGSKLMGAQEDMLEDVHLLKEPVNANMADGSDVPVTKAGTLSVQLQGANGKQEVVIKGVLAINQLVIPILSLPMLHSAGVESKGGPDGVSLDFRKSGGGIVQLSEIYTAVAMPCSEVVRAAVVKRAAATQGAIAAVADGGKAGVAATGDTAAQVEGAKEVSREDARPASPGGPARRKSRGGGRGRNGGATGAQQQQPAGSQKQHVEFDAVLGRISSLEALLGRMEVQLAKFSAGEPGNGPARV